MNDDDDYDDDTRNVQAGRSTQVARRPRYTGRRRVLATTTTSLSSRSRRFSAPV
ncbi:hypothetical protein ALC62_14097 [Cyphomyrmex costatus]|uniref:Uncharacterized protein n=1 Tax=Cyphomyrmex costatus TaxID=456900 RepID=A0A195C2X3_9HYME|nr:hypothetical protein ALC62_14097 [Cyphomyrmex costatus]